MPHGKHNIQEITLTAADIAAGKFTDWFSINDEFTARIVSIGGQFTGEVVVQRRNDEADTNIGVVRRYNQDDEEAGASKLTKSMEYRIGALAGALITVPGSLYLALIK